MQELQMHQIELEAQKEELGQSWAEAEQRNAELQRLRAESQAALERYTRFYDSAPVGYFTLAQDGSIVQLNLAAAELLGQNQSRLLATRFVQYIEPGDRMAFNDFLAGVFAGEGKERCTVGLRHPKHCRETVFAHLEGVRRESGMTCGVVAIDLSERKRAELLQDKYREQLQATVAQRTAELSAANQELEGFVYAASHDMKAPLARLSNLSTLLGHKYGGQLDDDGQAVLDLIRQNALRLNTLVEDLLAHTQIRKQPLSVQRVEVGALVRAVLQEQAEEIGQKGAEIRLELPSSLAVPADPFSLGQVLRNLIENALKYSAQATPPVIEIGAGLSDETCRLWVRDNGIGISERYHEQIFEIFRRLHTYSEYPGTGVGLALVKKAIERMGGQVRVESKLGFGATFHLEWPLSLHAIA